MNKSELVKRFHDAAEDKDLDAYRSVLHQDFCFQAPMMTTIGLDKFTTSVCESNFVWKDEVVSMIESEDQVACVFDWVGLKPFSRTIRISVWYTFEANQFGENRIRSADLYYDPSQFPKETH